MLLDIKNPRKVLARAPKFVMEPEYDYEKRGLMPDVVFPTGNVVIDGTLFVYYGAADKRIAVATVKLKDLLKYLDTFSTK